MPAKESEIRAAIKEYLQWTGWFIFYQLQGLGAYKGLSDLVAVKNGRVVFVEIKKPSGKQSEYQIQFQADLEASGGEYLVAKGVADVEFLNGVKK